jgi:hypothetical protein
VSIFRKRERSFMQIFGASVPPAVAKSTRGGTKPVEADRRKLNKESIASVLGLFHQVLQEDNAQ